MAKLFSAPAWAHQTNIYEVNIRQYTGQGTFNAFLPHLPRLKDMGVKTLWFMPITPISEKNRKGELGSYYACSDYTSINPEFGTLADFKNLVKESHLLGFKVIIDWVANHTGWDHRWTREYPDYYKWDHTTNDFKIASGMDDIIELNFENPETVAAMIASMKFWVEECDIDGFRCDLASWVKLDFWEQARPALETMKKLFWLGEFDELDHPGYGNVFDASYSWLWMHKTEEFYKNHLPFSVLNELLYRYNAIGDETMRAWFTSNHDENSWNGTEYEKYGNMALALAVFSCTWNGIPLVYNGQEIPMKAKRLAFFDKDEIPWAKENELHSFYKKLLCLRSTNPALRGGDATVRTYRLSTNVGEDVLTYLRKSGEDEVLVMINMSYSSQTSVVIDDPILSGVYVNVFSEEPTSFGSATKIDMNPWDFHVWRK